MSSIACLLVTCCLEQSRADVLANVIASLQEHAPELHEALTVFDNASTVPGVISVLRDSYANVHRADKNVGYWTAIDWWLDHVAWNAPKYTYIIESDMVHYGFKRVLECASYLDRHPDVGSVRLHQYSVVERHLYDKDRPVLGSKTNLWQSHTNRVTGEQVKIDPSESDIWSTTFLTQLPALNRYEAMRDVFMELRSAQSFSEPDFQRLYWQRYQRTAILDGGIFHCDLNAYGSGKVAGSWTDPNELNRLGYMPTRSGVIIPQTEYTVTRV